MLASVFILTYYLIRLSVRGLAYIGVFSGGKFRLTFFRHPVLGPTTAKAKGRSLSGRGRALFLFPIGAALLPLVMLALAALSINLNGLLGGPLLFKDWVPWFTEFNSQILNPECNKAQVFHNSLWEVPEVVKYDPQIHGWPKWEGHISKKTGLPLYPDELAKEVAEDYPGCASCGILNSPRITYVRKAVYPGGFYR
jgi:hypothetical protein